MTASPIVIGLKKRFGPRRTSSDGQQYRAFTTAFDEIVDSAELAALLARLSPEQKRSFDDAAKSFDTLFASERVEIAASGAALVRDLQRGFSAEERTRTVVSFLIDHSGSMRGLRMISALLAVEGAVDALDHANIATEILGFTTASWRGGKSRLAWRWAGRPLNPGRLCDLRYLVYGAADRSIRHPWHLRVALRPDMLRENIDGSSAGVLAFSSWSFISRIQNVLWKSGRRGALGLRSRCTSRLQSTGARTQLPLIWAASRLDPAKWTRRVICLVSDGAPIDDSTRLANDDHNLLARHLEQSEQRLAAEGFTIGTLLIGGEHVPEPALFERAEEPQEAGIALMRLVRRILVNQAPIAQRDAKAPRTA